MIEKFRVGWGYRVIGSGIPPGCGGRMPKNRWDRCVQPPATIGPPSGRQAASGPRDIGVPSWPRRPEKDKRKGTAYFRVGGADNGLAELSRKPLKRLKRFIASGHRAEARCKCQKPRGANKSPPARALEAAPPGEGAWNWPGAVIHKAVSTPVRLGKSHASACRWRRSQGCRRSQAVVALADGLFSRAVDEGREPRAEF